ncbi:leucine-rich repeat-containing G-protein coupled receptor 4-like [Apis cerana]|uniref:leucine-rich repeat-containing G-protein coupled receptor 4-like n=1 Tax=Apis cerana TaxID=7461 RepID=UPI00109BE9EB|nr:leucine-rich repeat-containing G-protein coupled receptor 4-like [Apis cerana]
MIQYKNFLLILIFAIKKCEGNPKISWDSSIINKNLDKMILEKESSVMCDNEEIVNLEGFELKNIPMNLVKSKTIEGISLKNNKISEVPSNIFHETPNLKCLNLAQNKILFKYFQLEHDRLKKLILDYQTETEPNEILSIPQKNVSKIKFPNLETLSWKYIKYDIFSSTLFPMIKNIYLSDSNLIYVASNITHLFPYLKNIHLENNMIQELIADDFRNVESLYLDKNPLRNLWFNAKYTNLKILSLSNSLHNIDITEINIPSLKTLDLSQNQISFIHEQMFKNIPFLEDLILSENKLLKFPNLFYLSNLKTLSLAYNLISEIKNINQLNSLKILNLQGNQINNIDKMAFLMLTELEFLDLSENKLQLLPLDWHDNLSKLKYLNLESNFFVNIQDMKLNTLINLRQLYIKNNYIVSIDLNTLQILPQKCTIYVI